MGHIEPMTASEIVYSYSSVLEDSVRDRLWGGRDHLRSQVNAIMESHGLKEKWEEHNDFCGLEAAGFVEQHFSGTPSAQKALLIRLAEIENLTKAWQDFYCGLKRIVKDENQKQRSES